MRIIEHEIGRLKEFIERHKDQLSSVERVNFDNVKAVSGVDLYDLQKVLVILRNKILYGEGTKKIDKLSV